MNEELENQVDETEEENGEGEKTFTQAEVDALISKRLKAAKKGMPGADELKAFRAWKQSHTSDEDELQTVTGERDSAQSELEIARRENYLLKQGIPADDVDYYVYKISKMVDDDTSFEDAAKQFLKENKRSIVRMDTSARINNNGGKNQTANDAMNALLRGAFK